MTRWFIEPLSDNYDTGELTDCFPDGTEGFAAQEGEVR